jgi:hypothetical protein
VQGLRAQDAGKRLANIVVQLLCDTPALAFLRGKRLPTTLAPLALEPIKHVVEDIDELANFLRPRCLQALAGTVGVDVTHRAPQPFQGREGCAQGERVEHEDRDQPGHEHDRLGQLDRKADRRRRDRDGKGRNREDGRVKEKDTLKEAATLDLHRFGTNHRRTLTAGRPAGRRSRSQARRP